MLFSFVSDTFIFILHRSTIQQEMSSLTGECDCACRAYLCLIEDIHILKQCNKKCKVHTHQYKYFITNSTQDQQPILKSWSFLPAVNAFHIHFLLCEIKNWNEMNDKARTDKASTQHSEWLPAHSQANQGWFPLNQIMSSEWNKTESQLQLEKDPDRKALWSDGTYLILKQSFVKVLPHLCGLIFLKKWNNNASSNNNKTPNCQAVIAHAFSSRIWEAEVD